MKIITVCLTGLIALTTLTACQEKALEPLPPTNPPQEFVPEDPAPLEPEVSPDSAYETGRAVGEQLDQMWEDTKSFSRGLWSQLKSE